MQRIIVPLLLLAFISLNAQTRQSQNSITISGTVIDQDSGQPLEYATFVLQEVENPDKVTGGITDLDGKFEIETDPGQYNIRVEYISYKTIKAKRIVFAEAYGLKKNPFFEYLPMTSTKGEYLTIKAPQLKETSAIKSSIFLIPWEKDYYRVGATYKWKDITNLPTEASKSELVRKLDTFLKCDYEIVDQLAGIRPTVTDRRPLVGRHPTKANMFVSQCFAQGFV